MATIDGINITLEELTNAAANIRRQNTEMSNILQSIQAQMKNLGNTWDSEAYRTIMGNFEKLTPKFTNYSDIIESYADFLDKTVTSYQNTENTNTTNATAFN